MVGDWDGNGSTTIGVFRPGDSTFYLRNSNTAGPPELTIQFGSPGDIPLAADWNGGGKSTIGVFTPKDATFRIRNENSSGKPDLEKAFGLPSDLPVVGDWNGETFRLFSAHRGSSDSGAGPEGRPARSRPAI